MRRGLFIAAVVTGFFALWPLYHASTAVPAPAQPVWDVPELCAFQSHGAVLTEDGSIPEGCEDGMPEHLLQSIPGQADVAMRHAYAWVLDGTYSPGTSVVPRLDAVPPWDELLANHRSAWLPVPQGTLAQIDDPDRHAWLSWVRDRQPGMRERRQEWVQWAKDRRQDQLEAFLDEQDTIRAANAGRNTAHLRTVRDGIIVGTLLDLLMLVLLGLRFMLPSRAVRLTARRLELFERQVPLDQVTQVVRTANRFAVRLEDGSHLELPESYAADVEELTAFVEVLQNRVDACREGERRETQRAALGKLAATRR